MTPQKETVGSLNLSSVVKLDRNCWKANIKSYIFKADFAGFQKTQNILAYFYLNLGDNLFIVYEPPLRGQFISSFSSISSVSSPFLLYPHSTRPIGSELPILQKIIGSELPILQKIRKFMDCNKYLSEDKDNHIVMGAYPCNLFYTFTRMIWYKHGVKSCQ